MKEHYREVDKEQAAEKMEKVENFIVEFLSTLEVHCGRAEYTGKAEASYSRMGTSFEIKSEFEVLSPDEYEGRYGWQPSLVKGQKVHRLKAEFGVEESVVFVPTGRRFAYAVRSDEAVMETFEARPETQARSGEAIGAFKILEKEVQRPAVSE